MLIRIFRVSNSQSDFLFALYTRGWTLIGLSKVLSMYILFLRKIGDFISNQPSSIDSVLIDFTNPDGAVLETVEIPFALFGAVEAGAAAKGLTWDSYLLSYLEEEFMRSKAKEAP